jgi:hypothetical protein
LQKCEQGSNNYREVPRDKQQWVTITTFGLKKRCRNGVMRAREKSSPRIQLLVL